MTKREIRIPDVKAANDFPSVLELVQDGADVIIEHDGRAVAIVSSIEQRRGRLLSESINLAMSHGSTTTLDGDFAHDLEDIINSHREPLNPRA
jgi:antitoxin (DNA-binding transcriptional repressor) of toxin-antitoxin stability system